MLKANPERDPDVFEKFNLAADASVNDRILAEMEAEERSYLSAPKGHISSDALKKMFKLRSIHSQESYLYYFNLISGKVLPENAQQLQCMLASGGSAEAGKDDVITVQNCGTPDDHQWDAGEDAEEAAAAVRELVNAATSIMNEEARGLSRERILNR